MTKSTLFFVLILCFTSCGPETIDWRHNKEYFKEENKILYFKGEPFTGTIEYNSEYYNDRDKKTSKKTLYRENQYVEGKKSGCDIWYTTDGKKLMKKCWLNNKREGEHKRWFDERENGSTYYLRVEGYYKNNKRFGEWKTYAPDGSLNYLEIFNDRGKRISKKYIN